ncbi:MAG: hypothetical protein LAO21_18125 [Acidobacteriia bacterium]|nr:hypothetical protein [Terriglobia bacterium]
MESENVKMSGLDFGIVIAFIAPGFVALQAASYHFSTVRAWMAAASDKEQTVGLFLFVLLASLSMGLVVSGVRALAIDNLLRFRFVLRGLVVPKVQLDWSQIDSENLSILITIRDAFFRHYQFYSNTLVALLFWAFSHAFSDRPKLPWYDWALITSLLVVLFFSGRDSLQRYANAVNKAFDS